MKNFPVEYVVEEIVTRVNQKRGKPLSEEECISIKDKIAAWSNRYSRDNHLSESEFVTGWELDNVPELADIDLKYDVRKALWFTNPREKLSRDLVKFFQKNKFGDSLQEFRKEEIQNLIRNDLYLPDDTKVSLLPSSMASALDENGNLIVCLGANQQKFLVHFNEEHQSFDQIFKSPHYSDEPLNSNKILQIFSDFDHTIRSLRNTAIAFNIADKFKENLSIGERMDLEPSLTEEGYLLMATYSTDNAFSLHFTKINSDGNTDWQSITASRYGDKSIETKDLRLEKNGQYYFRGYPVVSLQEAVEVSRIH